VVAKWRPFGISDWTRFFAKETATPKLSPSGTGVGVYEWSRRRRARHTHACPQLAAHVAGGSAGRALVEPPLPPARSSSMDGPDVFARLAAEREEIMERIAAHERQIAGLAEEQALTANDDEHDHEGVPA
jgi:hypothetical protein